MSPPSSPSQNVKPASRLLVLSTVSFYMFAAIAMVLANKWVLNKTSIPVFFLFSQLLIAVLLLALSKSFGIFQISLRLERDVCKALIPMVAINVLGLNFNNLTLKFVDASFYQVARGLLLPITVGLSTLILHTRPSLRILFSCAIVTLGFFVGVLIDNPGGSSLWFLNGTSPSTATEPSVTNPDPISRRAAAVAAAAVAASAPSFLGILFGILSSCTTALHAVVIKRSLDAVKGNTLQLAWYSNVLSAAVMAPMVIFAGEVPGILELLFGGFIPGAEGEGEGLSALATFLWGTALTGFVGFLICIAGFLSIKITSPITHMVSAAVRGVLQTFLSVVFFSDVITSGRASSITIILGGSIYYTYVKNDETFHEAANASARAKATPALPHHDEEERLSMLENGEGVGKDVLFSAEGEESLQMDDFSGKKANGHAHRESVGRPRGASRSERMD